jgi:hypothetical protein
MQLPEVVPRHAWLACKHRRVQQPSADFGRSVTPNVHVFPFVSVNCKYSNFGGFYCERKFSFEKWASVNKRYGFVESGTSVKWPSYVSAWALQFQIPFDPVLKNSWIWTCMKKFLLVSGTCRAQTLLCGVKFFLVVWCKFKVYKHVSEVALGEYISRLN